MPKPTKEHVRHCILFHYNSGCNATVATRKICEVYGDVLQVRSCQRWYRKFDSGDFDMEDAPRPGRPEKLAQFDVEVVNLLVEHEPKLSCRDLANRLGSSRKTVLKHLHKLGRTYVDGKWVRPQTNNNNNNNKEQLHAVKKPIKTGKKTKSPLK